MSMKYLYMYTYVMEILHLYVKNLCFFYPQDIVFVSQKQQCLLQSQS